MRMRMAVVAVVVSAAWSGSAAGAAGPPHPTIGATLAQRGPRLVAHLATTVRCAGRSYRVTTAHRLHRSGARVTAHAVSARRLPGGRRLVGAWAVRGRVAGGSASGTVTLRARIVRGATRRGCRTVDGRRWSAPLPAAAGAPPAAPPASPAAPAPLSADAILAGLPLGPANLSVATDSTQFPAQARWSITVSGDPTDYISAGQSWTLTSATPGGFDITVSAGGIGASFVMRSHDPTNGTDWNVLLGIGSGPFPGAGTYTGSDAPGGPVPWLDVSGMGRGCGESTSAYTLGPTVFDARGFIRSFVVRFEQRCVENPGAAMRGTFAFQAP
jgi:hypothetical protein